MSLFSKVGLNLQPKICYFGVLKSNQNFNKSPLVDVTDNFSNQKVFGILDEERRKHMYILGKTGMGKTTLLENMILQDIYNGFGACFIDPHGDSSNYIVDRIPLHRQKDLVYFNPSDINYPIGLNVLESQLGEQPFLIASGLMAVFNKIWSGLWSSRMEYILNNILLTLLETEGNTLLGVVKILTDDNFRENLITKVKDPLVKNFWYNEFGKYNSRYKQEAISPILNKIGQFFSTELIRNILGQQKSTLNIRQIMDEQKILIVNLSKGKLGEDNSNLLGSLLVAKLQIAAMSRVDILERNRKDFYVYVDEFQNFTTDSFASILSEARKYRLNLILAHQYVSQLTESGSHKVKNAIFGNVGTMINFRVGAQDAQELNKEFSPVFSPRDLVGLDRTEIILKLSVKNKISPPFKANTIAPVFDKLNGYYDDLVEISRQKYGSNRDSVVQKINKDMEITIPKPYEKNNSKNQKSSKSETKISTLPSLKPILPKKLQIDSKWKLFKREEIIEMKIPKKNDSRLNLSNFSYQSIILEEDSEQKSVIASKVNKIEQENLQNPTFDLPE
jgi:hypothetical protein